MVTVPAVWNVEYLEEFCIMNVWRHPVQKRRSSLYEHFVYAHSLETKQLIRDAKVPNRG